MLALSAGLLCHSCKEKPSPVDYADPTIGGVSVLLETTRQTIHLPNEMLRFMPLRSSMLDDWIGDFSLQMVNHRTLWAYAFMPFCTPTPEENWGKPGVCNNEETHPHYYHAQLDGVDLEFTPSRHSGIMRLTYQGEGLHTIRLRTRTKTGGFSLANRVLTGTAVPDASCTCATVCRTSAQNKHEQTLSERFPTSTSTAPVVRPRRHGTPALGRSR